MTDTSSVESNNNRLYKSADNLTDLEKLLINLSNVILLPTDYEFLRSYGDDGGFRSSSYRMLTYVTHSSMIKYMNSCLGGNWSMTTDFREIKDYIYATCVITIKDDSGSSIVRQGSCGLKPVYLKDKSGNTRAEVTYGSMVENAFKSAETKAFKRACFACGLARYLYDLPPIFLEKSVHDDYNKNNNVYCLKKLKSALLNIEHKSNLDSLLLESLSSY